MPARVPFCLTVVAALSGAVVVAVVFVTMAPCLPPCFARSPTVVLVLVLVLVPVLVVLVLVAAGAVVTAVVEIDVVESTVGLVLVGLVVLVLVLAATGAVVTAVVEIDVVADLAVLAVLTVEVVGVIVVVVGETPQLAPTKPLAQEQEQLPVFPTAEPPFAQGCLFAPTVQSPAISQFAPE